MVEHVCADEASTDVPGDVFGMLHRAVVGAPEFQDGLRHLVLGGDGQRHQQHGRKGKDGLFHKFVDILR